MVQTVGASSSKYTYYVARVLEVDPEMVMRDALQGRQEFKIRTYKDKAVIRHLYTTRKRTRRHLVAQDAQAWLDAYVQRLGGKP